MAMTIKNNNAAMMTLGELNKNTTALGKQLKKVSSGMRINGAGDDASGYSISEKMRVRIRALEQNERNVQNGAALLRTAEGAIQQQIEIMKTIKAKVIDADNDTNTDIDRATIQKEIEQGYQQINDIAYDTNYNGKRLLIGDTVKEVTSTWQILKEPIQVEDSDAMNIIPDVYTTLDGQTGPFDVLPPYRTEATTAEPLLGSNESVTLSGGTLATPASFSMDLSGYASPADLMNKGFYTVGYNANATQSKRQNYVLTDGATVYNPAGYGSNVTAIDISGCTTVDQVATKIAAAVNGNTSTGFMTATASGKTVTLKSQNTTSGAGDQSQVGGWRLEAYSTGGSGTIASTQLNLAGKKLSGGQDTVYGYDTQYDPATDQTTTTSYVISPATRASLSENVSGASPDSGIIVTGYNNRTAFLLFCGSGSAHYNELVRNSDTGAYYVGLGSSGSLSLQGLLSDGNEALGITLSMSGGVMTLTATSAGASSGQNNYGITHDGVTGGGSGSGDTVYTAIASFDINKIAKTDGADGGYATYNMNLDAYNTTDGDKLEEFISALSGKSITMQNHYYYNSGSGDTGTYSTQTFEFIDTGIEGSMASMRHLSYSNPIDLNAVRTAVAGGQKIADAFIALMQGKGYYGKFLDASTGSNKILQARAYRPGTYPNDKDKLSIQKGTMSSYTIDFNNWFNATAASIDNLPEFLDGKGFRVYCATCPDQWFNFQYTAGGEEDADRPRSGSSGADLDTILIDVSEVTDAKSLADAIYEQAAPAMEALNHTLFMAAGSEDGQVVIYDRRQFALTRYNYQYLQEQGAKLADGVLDDVAKIDHKVYTKNLIIQHTDKANQNILLKLPQTTMDHLFNFIPGYRELSEFNVMTAESRETLLGNQAGRYARDGYTLVRQEERGLLDRALDYLTSANVLVGAQIMRLGMTENNIVTSRESTTNSESTIRDADMAKEMAGYTKANVLAQAAQSMLAQANQNSSAVLSLLQ